LSPFLRCERRKPSDLAPSQAAGLGSTNQESPGHFCQSSTSSGAYLDGRLPFRCQMLSHGWLTEALYPVKSRSARLGTLLVRRLAYLSISSGSLPSLPQETHQATHWCPKHRTSYSSLPPFLSERGVSTHTAIPRNPKSSDQLQQSS
ncbi:hypothetical protein BN1708_001896, partial [Verticillium longisporum]